jgi:hypothetical protein
VGDLPAGTGFTKPSRQVSFQIQFTPSLSQVSTGVDLVRDITMTAIDSYTNAILTRTAKNLTTRMTNDPQFRGEEETIVK